MVCELASLIPAAMHPVSITWPKCLFYSCIVVNSCSCRLSPSSGDSLSLSCEGCLRCHSTYNISEIQDSQSGASISFSHISTPVNQNAHSRSHIAVPLLHWHRMKLRLRIHAMTTETFTSKKALQKKTENHRTDFSQEMCFPLQTVPEWRHSLVFTPAIIRTCFISVEL